MDQGNQQQPSTSSPVTPDEQNSPADTAQIPQQAMPAQDVSSQSTVQPQLPQAGETQTPAPQQSSDIPSTEEDASSDQGAQKSTEATYIDNVGGSLVGLLTDISLNDEMLRKVADTMRIPVDQATGILDGLLEKIDNGDISDAELAFLITSPVAEESAEQEKSA